MEMEQTYDAFGNVTGDNTNQYLYDGDGTRVANDYILSSRASDDRDDLNANNTETWAHTNVWAGGKLMATYDNTGNGLRFYLVDPLGTQRAQTNSIGEGEQTCHLSDEALLGSSAQ